jgi:hypothetical protein
MENELRRCFVGCCRFVNNQSVAEAEYERAVTPQSSLSIKTTPETFIACRKGSGQHRAVETSVGFFLGQSMYRAFGTFLPTGKTFIFDSTNGQLLREATEADIKKWNDAWRAFVETHRQQS